LTRPREAGRKNGMGRRGKLVTPDRRSAARPLLRVVPRPVTRLFFLLPLFFLAQIHFSCRDGRPPPAPPAKPPVRESAAEKKPGLPDWARPRSQERMTERKEMVRVIREEYGLTDEKVLRALLKVPRHWFVPEEMQEAAYEDTPLPIGYGQTISQPYIVAYMTSVLDLNPEKKVLEIGTGSGYQAAVLNELTPHVYTIEVIPQLAARTMKLFREKGYSRIKTRIGDGYLGWPEGGEFGAIIVTCAPDNIPPPLLKQLKRGGRMVIPVGGLPFSQELVLVRKDAEGKISHRNLMPVRFVPLIRPRK